MQISECRLTLQKCNDWRVLYFTSHWFSLGILVFRYTQGTQVFVYLKNKQQKTNKKPQTL